MRKQLTSGPRLEFNQSLDRGKLASLIERTGCVQIADFLCQAGAPSLQQELLARADWKRVINGREKVFETDANYYVTMDPEERRKLDAAVYSSATHGFQFQYDTIRIADDLPSRERDNSMLSRFARFMCESDSLNFFRSITDEPKIVFADAQATRYRAGDFLTRHDDAIGGKHRSYAYVLSLSADWQAEWGGLLLLNDHQGGIAQAIVPRFNNLVLFRVGQPHSVSFVAPYAGSDRLSITGWLRTQMP